MYRVCAGRVFLAEKEAEAYSRKIGIGRVIMGKSGHYLVVLSESKERRRLDYSYEAYRRDNVDVFIQKDDS